MGRQEKRREGYNRKKEKFIFLALLLVAFISTSIEDVTAQSSELYFSDESGMLQESVEKKLDVFNAEHRYTLAIFVRKKSIRETQQNHLEDALRVFDQQKRKAEYISETSESQRPLPAFLLYYNAADRIFVVVQQKDKILEDVAIQTIQNKYQEQKKVLKTIPVIEGEEIKKSANTLMVLLLSDLMMEIDKKEQEEKQIEQQRKQEGDNLCSPLKDGICDATCLGIDLDCLCGDGICQYHETSETCLNDCGEGRNIACGVITDGRCAGNCITKDIDCYFEELAERAFQYGETKKISANVMTQIFLSLVIILSLILLILMQIVRLKHEKERQKQTFGKDDFIQRLLRYQEKESEQLMKKGMENEKKNDKKKAEKEKR